MERRTLQFIADACRGELKNALPGTVVSRISTDSRAVQPGDLFIALAGERFDAHSFLGEVIKNGAVGILAEKGKVPAELSQTPVILVDNTRQALGELASRYRADFQVPYIAVGGSNGKTSTKDLIASVLRQKLVTVASEASFNNDIGVPLTLLQLEKKHQAAVLEVGTNHPGEIAPLLRIIRPRYSVITSIGREHLEFFGDMDGIIKEEGTLAELLPVNGKLFINGETEWLAPILKRCRVPVVKIGWSDRCDYSARNVRLTDAGVTFTASAPRKDFSGEYQIQLLGKHQVLNSLLAIALGAELGLGRAEITRGLAACPPAKLRMQSFEVQGIRVLDDTYNANADSMLAALQTLADLPIAGRRVAVLGDMAELGTHAQAAHAEIGRRAIELGVQQVIAVGKMAAETASGARNAGCKHVTEVADVETAIELVRAALHPGDTILLKASRSSRLERISEALKGGKP